MIPVGQSHWRQIWKHAVKWKISGAGVGCRDPISWNSALWHPPPKKEKYLQLQGRQWGSNGSTQQVYKLFYWTTLLMLWKSIFFSHIQGTETYLGKWIWSHLSIRKMLELFPRETLHWKKPWHIVTPDTLKAKDILQNWMPWADF